ncbi:Hsp20/alpha crystallin family protein [Pusillimonas sp.]|uniref:Hsp20/alpha crystallin family protein n=1 Tax=Pusillimonas sp. TaxID=3040095 RepID=UPI0029B0A1CA|nr:Hsp20/alpha crystallin family protein [Pusillimonas sp.]MDX3893200.1 Hsp20/alpha crystallin family protein [Pusillimonas sp.]
MANNLVQFDPFNGLARLSPMRDFDDLFNEFRLHPFFGNVDAEQRIRMDVSETEQGYTIKAEMPGIRKEDVKVVVEGNRVSISAESSREEEKKEGETVVRRERYVGRQSRSFALAHDIDDSKAVAKYQDGVLELSLPKKSGDGSRKMLPVS